MRKILTLLVALTLLAVSSACSSDDGDDGSTTTTEAVDDAGGEAEVPEDLDDATEDDYVAALSESLRTGDAEAGDLVLADEEAGCLAGRWVAVIGVDRLQAANVAPSTFADSGFDVVTLGLGRAEAEEMLAGFEGCGLDLADLVLQTLVSGAPEDVQACAAENLDRDLVDAVVLSSFTDEAGDGEEAYNALIDDLAEACPVG